MGSYSPAVADCFSAPRPGKFRSRKYLARKWYTPRSLDRTLHAPGLVKIDSAGHVFGNLHYGDHRWFSAARAIQIDDFFWRRSQRTGFRWLRYFSDNHIAVYRFRE